jgi:hypothetical protein
MSNGHILRTNIRFNLDVIRATYDCLDRDLEKSLIFAAVSAANVGHLDDDPLLIRQYAHVGLPDDLRRPIHMQRVAESLGLPRETTRIKVKALIQAGLLESTRAGLLVPSASMYGPRFEAMAPRYLVALGEAVERLAASACAGLAGNERLSATPPVWGAMRFISQHVLRGTVDLRFYTAPMPLLGSYLFLAMADATGFRFGEDPERANADQDQAPPGRSDLRISASALAERLAMPRETVRRNLKALVQQGWLLQDPDGFGLLARQAVEDRQRVQLVQERAKADLVRLIRRLRQIGAIVSDAGEKQDRTGLR